MGNVSEVNESVLIMSIIETTDKLWIEYEVNEPISNFMKSYLFPILLAFLIIYSLLDIGKPSFVADIKAECLSLSFAEQEKTKTESRKILANMCNLKSLKIKELKKEIENLKKELKISKKNEKISKNEKSPSQVGCCDKAVITAQEDMYKAFPDGLKIRHKKTCKTEWIGTYNKEQSVEQSVIIYDGKLFTSPSGFAKEHYEKESDRKTKTANGWDECEAKNQNGKWRSISELREFV
tara:strand:- start:1575 stop:2285 length:711 start_codon:yes stop_codon:yes gene_type:complete